MIQSSEIVHLFTDGACRGNPGPGGWGVVLSFKGHVKHLCGGVGHTTNNRMELLAVIKGMEALTRPCRVKVTTDSQYVKNGITTWIHTWKRNGWRTASKQEVKNVDLWQQLDELVARHQLEWAWVKGHSGHPENETADRLANKGIDGLSA
ncbi:MAG: ribonuclease HI [Gammaproteobacteria bacterium]|nr:ribonuclease HI [Gammaproteobacteria bacterium]MBU1655656.1 ribonuclease HI [Gammaproteobacteria bacterium]MBU1960309.1 ribonuclease HI [Gammaproteobacteria bacterium]